MKEQFTGFELNQIQGISPEKNGGFHSVIREITIAKPGELSPMNILEKHYGPKAQGFELSQAQEISDRIRSFMDIASAIDIPVPPLFVDHVICKNGHPDKFDLLEYVPNVGKNLLQEIEQRVTDHKPDQAHEYFRTYLQYFRRVWEAGFPISLDPPLTNFCVDNNNQLWYVDCMPPRQRLDDGTYISEWPTPPPESQQFIIDRYFSPQQARVIYAQALRALLPLGFNIDDIRNTINTELGEEAEDAITITPNQQQQLFLNPLPTDVDLLRISAAEAYGKQSIDADMLRTVYGFCHIGIGGILPEVEELKQACQLLNSI